METRIPQFCSRACAYPVHIDAGISRFPDRHSYEDKDKLAKNSGTLQGLYFLFAL